jgi:hypothetical protein
MMRLVAGLVLVAGAVIPATTALGAPAASGEAETGLGIRLVDVPVSSADDPRARAYIIDHVAPGTVIERRVEVSNGTDAPMRVSVYSAAADIGDGAFVGAPGRTPNELSSWTSLSRDTVSLEAGDDAMVAVDIAVPADATSGERYAAVWAQTTTQSETSEVKQVSRVGIRLYVSVGPGGEPASDFDIISVTSSLTPEGIPAVQAMVRNTGHRALDLEGHLMLTAGPGGLSAGPFPVTVGATLGIGDAAPVTFVLNRHLPRGPWNARLTLISGLVERTSRATITFPARPGVGVAVPLNAGGAGGRWWVAGAAAACLLLLAGWLWSLRRRPR